MDFILTMHELSKRYRHFQALYKLTMHIPKGSIYGLIGRNGAGKTTLIRTIAGLQRPDEGFYCLNGVKHKMCIRDRSGSPLSESVRTSPKIIINNREIQNAFCRFSRNKPVFIRLRMLVPSDQIKIIAFQRFILLMKRLHRCLLYTSRCV